MLQLSFEDTCSPNRPFSHRYSHMGLLGVFKSLWCHQLTKVSPRDFAYILHVQKTKYKANIFIQVMYEAQIFS